MDIWDYILPIHLLYGSRMILCLINFQYFNFGFFKCSNHWMISRYKLFNTKKRSQYIIFKNFGRIVYSPVHRKAIQHFRRFWNHWPLQIVGGDLWNTKFKCWEGQCQSFGNLTAVAIHLIRLPLLLFWKAAASLQNDQFDSMEACT